ncbi:hypothetical protein N5079_07760 [Planotetraspora sp. A-T 1434]|uniref:hypothetical protein n=1 Tax=Planotetraspora sp. A-T 1434 TaxID=2979219 RepID=UPI0021C06214|nr:hypothetical protein [Planotetraspora sp. A-T 1434]MCT9930118.1 hypothetical protein [Planotetraspora sp. A-T 1434]
MSWLNAQVRMGALERQSDDLARVLGRPAQRVADRLPSQPPVYLRQAQHLSVRGDAELSSRSC